ncbi:Ppx/GppA family phosphatase [Kocuria rhizophila]|uniref:Ppx/GppA family phosphatase n=1 Tax=Kocuria rhizophila TaxID=72000 RepID=A0AAX2SFD8_KOCRH|nr:MULTISPECIES: Ppx/GppA phosphatase family protein [Kocuria]WIW68057.1 Ppx/GppA phosphatase family protein [Kocuria sp. ChxB]KIC70199.1 exopolyphosphatase [Kocuria rhizophila]KUP28309.1 exopolyphosphatase [Kocuria rhizophila]MCR4525300.1 Ppx/GppA family phosphatase [Kocuria rhizophila]MCT1546515.1 Ppx/GppA family phosphatase [Kocuria rhizophila]
MRVAAIDCGTNSIRLLIADVVTREHHPALKDVVREMRIVRLGQGVDATGWLAEAALERTFAAVDEYAALITEHGADRVRFVATSATRDAGNRDVFVAGIRSRLGVVPEVVSGDEEAALSFRGALNAAPGLDPADRVLVVDVGGGSTECVLGTPREVLAARSVDVGCVRMTERHLGSNPPTEEQQAHVLRDVDEAMDVVARTVPLEQTTRLVGVAGTVTTVTAMAMGLKRYDPDRINGTVLDVADVDRACRELTAMTRKQRARLGFMHEGRVDVIGAGALVWRRVVERVARATDGRVDTVTASEHDILDGIGLSLVS